MKKIMLYIVMSICIYDTAIAQQAYQSAVGLKLGGYGETFSVTYKKFLDDRNALDLHAGITFGQIFHLTDFGIGGTASYQRHFDLPIEALKWYVSVGAGFYAFTSEYEDYSGVAIPVMPLGGADYTFKKIPLNVSAEFGPSITLIKPYDIPVLEIMGSVSARYILN